MNDFQKEYALWDDFLSVWPASRLTSMTLDEYSQAGSKDSFTYWIESRLDELGSIWGGSAFKFGVFSRKDTEGKSSDAKLSYSESHGWYSSLGTSAEAAFEKIRNYVAQVAGWAAKGDLEAIESFGLLGEAFKWKIAFHYQNRQAPVIVDHFQAGTTGGIRQQQCKPGHGHVADSNARQTPRRSGHSGVRATDMGGMEPEKPGDLEAIARVRRFPLRGAQAIPAERIGGDAQ